MAPSLFQKLFDSQAILFLTAVRLRLQMCFKTSHRTCLLEMCVTNDFWDVTDFSTKNEIHQIEQDIKLSRVSKWNENYAAI